MTYKVDRGSLSVSVRHFRTCKAYVMTLNSTNAFRLFVTNQKEVIVFLVREPDGEFEVLNGVQGKLTVHKDTKDGTLEDVSGAKTSLKTFLNRLRQLTKGVSS